VRSADHGVADLEELLDVASELVERRRPLPGDLADGVAGR